MVAAGTTMPVTAVCLIATTILPTTATTTTVFVWFVSQLAGIAG